MRGLRNHHWLDGARFIAEATTAPEFSMVSLQDFPGVVHSGQTAIKGEIYLVDDHGLSQLDRLESNGSFYSRKRIKISDSVCWIYLLPEDYLEDYEAIGSGDWRNWREAC